MNDKIKYLPPLCVDLSQMAAQGQTDDVPLGICAAGNMPTVSSCGGGAVPTQPDFCSPVGNSPDVGQCGGGSMVASGCTSGADIRFGTIP